MQKDIPLQKESVADPAIIPILYAVAMGVDAVAALIFGRLFDRLGLSTMMLVAGLSAFFAPLVFFGNFPLAVLGMALWGIGMGAQESIMRAAIAGMILPKQRGLAYGLFNMVYGIAWFFGSVLIGVLYDVSIPWLVLFGDRPTYVNSCFLFCPQTGITGNCMKDLLNPYQKNFLRSLKQSLCCAAPASHSAVRRTGRGRLHPHH
jgi:MFS family permease